MTNPTPITEERLREIEALREKARTRPLILGANPYQDYADELKFERAVKAATQAASDAFPDLAAALREAWTENERLKSSRDLAYGLLWGMSIDRRCKSDDLAARARETLLSTMNKSDQSAGITAARAALNPKGDGK